MAPTNPPRNEYPRPQFERAQWQNLNGEWEFSFDTDCFDRRIVVPFAYQTRLSGVDIQDFHDVVWYRRTFEAPKDLSGRRLLLHFGAVDYRCRLWINGEYILEHTGGHIGFEADITAAVRAGANEIRLQVFDETGDMEMPRGKQYWRERSQGIFYTRTTGIWQTVWLETVRETYLADAAMTPDIDRMAVGIRYEVRGPLPARLRAEIAYEGVALADVTVALARGEGEFWAALDQQILREWNFAEGLVWSPEHPRLFDIRFTVLAGGGEVLDEVKSYFGMRKVSISNGRLLLNNRPCYQKLLLDQGYWEESLLTAPDDEAFIRDIEMAKEMGFNGVRLHQKIEDPRFLYHADRLGFLVWGEICAAYVYSQKYVKRITDEWIDEILRDYSHPCIVAWTPLNESWGVPNICVRGDMQSHSAAMVHLTKSLDQTRPVISNDGWEHTCTDLLTIHDYEYRREVLAARYATLEGILSARPAGRAMFAEGWAYAGQPILVTEFGGISYQKGRQEGWGYSSAASDEDYAERYYNVVSPLLESEHVQGFCYTQLCDVEQEINGVLTYDRRYKIDPAVIRAINEGKWTPKG